MEESVNNYKNNNSTMQAFIFSDTPNVWYIEPTINRNAYGATVAYSLNGTSWLLDLTDVALKKVPIVYNKNGVITEDTIKVQNCSVQVNRLKY